jgi:hypothetical protein
VVVLVAEWHPIGNDGTHVLECDYQSCFSM